MFANLLTWSRPSPHNPIQIFTENRLTQSSITGDIVVLSNRKYVVSGKLELNKTLIVSPNTVIEVSGELIINAPMGNLPDGIFDVVGTGRVLIKQGPVYANWFASHGDFSHSIRCAILAASDWKYRGKGSGRTVRIRGGEYVLKSTIGIPDVSIIGDGWDCTTFTVDIPDTTDATFSQVHERDSVTPQRSDGGRSEITGFTLRGTRRNMASGVHVYGDGHRIYKVRTDGMYDGIITELPIMVTIDTCYTFNSKRRGIWVKQANINGITHIGTSLSIRNCWAYRCGGSGFRIETLAYSSVDNCASQECGYLGDTVEDTHGWSIVGNLYGEGMMTSVSFRNIAIEGDCKGVYVRDVRGITLDSIKYVWGGTGTHVGPSGSLITVGNMSGVISNMTQGSLTSNGTLSGEIITTDVGDIIDNRLYAHIGFIPDPNNSKWIYDNTGKQGSIALMNSAVVLRPIDPSAKVGNTETSRFSLVNSQITNV